MGAGSVLGEPADDGVADDAAVPLADVGGEHVATEEEAEGGGVGDLEDAVGADQHVHVDGVDVLAERPALAAAGQDLVQQGGGR